ncbi:hypothetical protein A9267_09830 [Shewanella sp. UCD-FRSSP16_17]|uniref:phage integrase central domain-containing protein n=1 Tax=Shewanella sp. UCD-FRSSP16_17 TaxID=1853256 RepID=UPI0007EEAC49|nr:phage integrase SAM-like domain-containing protein [Shewanella sp. UCD-FRSSP16_17]OBT09277.1 hypothetical protein A9267_09830 [Shewanella sp. UCD-FRSSP16_17]
MSYVIKDYLKIYLSFRRINSAPSTFNSERSKAAKLSALIGRQAIDSIRHSDILKLIEKLDKTYSNKTINEFFIILRAVFTYALRDGLIHQNPMEGIQNRKVSHKEPQPFP